MARVSKRLTQKMVDRLGDGRHGDGDGLYLVVGSGRRRWTFLWIRDGRRRELGLGSAKDVSLAEAREKADEARRMIRDGGDPIEARRAAEAAPAVPTFGEAADAFIAALAPTLRNAKHLAQWRVTLGAEEYDLTKIRSDPVAHEAHRRALKALRATRVDAIDRAAVLSVVEPLWTSAPETGDRIRNRIERILDAVEARGHRSGPNPAALKTLRHVLPRRAKLSVRHHAALPFDDIPQVVAGLRATAGASALGLEFLILCASRTAEVLGAKWPEVDFEKRVWTIPAERMKGGKPHRVPLTDAAIRVLTAAAAIRHADDGYIFPGQGRGKPLSQMSLAMALRRLGLSSEATPHGFRSSFRDWCSEIAGAPRELAEMALAHTVENAVEAAYRRGDLFERRRALMQRWAAFCEPRPKNVVPLRPAGSVA